MIRIFTLPGTHSAPHVEGIFQLLTNSLAKLLGSIFKCELKDIDHIDSLENLESTISRFAKYFLLTNLADLTQQMIHVYHYKCIVRATIIPRNECKLVLHRLIMKTSHYCIQSVEMQRRLLRG